MLREGITMQISRSASEFQKSQVYNALFQIQNFPYQTQHLLKNFV